MIPNWQTKLISQLKNKNLGLRTLANQTGTSIATLSRFLNGEEVKANTLVKILNYLNINIDSQSNKKLSCKNCNKITVCKIFDTLITVLEPEVISQHASFCPHYSDYVSKS